MSSKQPKRPSGCLAAAGWFLSLLAALMVAFGIFFWIDDERSWTAAQKAEGEAVAAWEAHAEEHEAAIARFDSLQVVAFEAGDSLLAEAYGDSVMLHVRPATPHLGFPLGGLVSIFIFIIALFPLVAGLSMLLSYYTRRSNWRSYERWRQSGAGAPPPPAPQGGA